MLKRAKTAAVIASYNQQEYIEESILSVIDQVDEVVVVDDFSTDNTVDVIQKMKFPSLKIILNQKNLGVSSSYNIAVESTSADFIFVQGGDDISLPGRVDTQLEMLQSNSDAVFAFSLPEIIDSSGRLLPDFVAQEFFETSDYSSVFARLYLQGNYICAPTVCLRKNKYIEHGGFNPGIKFLQDYDLWLNLSAYGHPVSSPSPVLRYRKHPGNLSGEDGPSKTFSERYWLELEYVLEKALTMLPAESLPTLAESMGFPQFVTKKLPEKYLRLQILLSHPQPSQNKKGMNLLFQLLEKQDRHDVLNFLDYSQEWIDENCASAGREINLRIASQLILENRFTRNRPEQDDS